MSDSDETKQPEKAAKPLKKRAKKAPTPGSVEKRASSGKQTKAKTSKKTEPGSAKKKKAVAKTSSGGEKKPATTKKKTTKKKKKAPVKRAKKAADPVVATAAVAGPADTQENSQPSRAEVATEDAAQKAKPPTPPPRDQDDGMMQPPKAPAEAGAPLWVVTFADLMSLLMCFFVMLLAMSSLEITTFKKMVESMKVGLGKSMSTEMEEFGVEQILSEAQILEAAAREQTRKQAAEMRQLLKREISDGKIEVEEGDQQITIQILQAGSFAAGSSTLKKSFTTISTKLKNSLDKIPGAITVAGHTDNQPMNTKQFRSNWELSSARAFSVIHSLLKKSDLEPSRFVLRGFAETRPRVPNDSKQNRAKNRRVEIIIDQRSSSNLTGTDNPDNLERIIINAETLDNYQSEHVRPVESVGQPDAPAPK